MKNSLLPLWAAVCMCGAGCVAWQPLDEEGAVVSGPIKPAGDQCEVDSQCQPSGNPCMVSACVDNVCATVAAPADTACDDADACTAGDVCVGGTCHGTAITCDDADECTDDTCDPATGCKFTANTVPCDDADACTAGDTCKDGACVPGTVLYVGCCTADVQCGALGFAWGYNVPCATTPECPQDMQCVSGQCVPAFYDAGCTVDPEDTPADFLSGKTGRCTTCRDEDANGVCLAVEFFCAEGFDDDRDLLVDCDDPDCALDPVCLPTCTPNCAGLACGPNGCGGSCGDCTGNTVCVVGSCAAPEGLLPGDCVGGVDEDKDGLTDCADGGCAANPACAPECAVAADCDDADACTADTCLAGNCQNTLIAGCKACAVATDCDDADPCTTDICMDGMCSAPVAVPACCNSNTDCVGGTVCVNNTCQAPTCTPDCTGKQCGDDGCGGSCGTCPAGQTCTAAGQCVLEIPECAVNADCPLNNVCIGGKCFQADGQHDTDGDCYCGVGNATCTGSINPKCSSVLPGDCDPSPSGGDVWSLCQAADGAVYIVTAPNTCLTGGVQIGTTDGSILNNPSMHDKVGDGFNNDCDGQTDEGGTDQCPFEFQGTAGIFKVTCGFWSSL